MPPKRRTADQPKDHDAQAAATRVPRESTTSMRRGEEDEDDWLRRTPASAPQRASTARSSITPSPRLSRTAAAQELKRTPRFAQKRGRSNDSADNSSSGGSGNDNPHNEGEDEEGMRHTATGDERRSVSSVGLRAGRESAALRVDEGFFHDLRSMHPLRVRLGVCPLPGDDHGDKNHNSFGVLPTADESIRRDSRATSVASAPATTALLLAPRRFLTLPEEKGGSDVVGWAAAFSSVSLELPGEGVYNKASVSVTVMLPP